MTMKTDQENAISSANQRTNPRKISIERENKVETLDLENGEWDSSVHQS